MICTLCAKLQWHLFDNKKIILANGPRCQEQILKKKINSSQKYANNALKFISKNYVSYIGTYDC